MTNPIRVAIGTPAEKPWPPIIAKPNSLITLYYNGAPAMGIGTGSGGSSQSCVNNGAAGPGTWKAVGPAVMKLTVRGGT